jgi:hypothetical protein
MRADNPRRRGCSMRKRVDKMNSCNCSCVNPGTINEARNGKKSTINVETRMSITLKKKKRELNLSSSSFLSLSWTAFVMKGTTVTADTNEKSIP